MTYKHITLLFVGLIFLSSFSLIAQASQEVPVQTQASQEVSADTPNRDTLDTTNLEATRSDTVAVKSKREIRAEAAAARKAKRAEEKAKKAEERAARKAKKAEEKAAKKAKRAEERKKKPKRRVDPFECTGSRIGC